MKIKGFFVLLLLATGYWLLATDFAFAENCDKEIAKTYVKKGNVFVEDTIYKVCPKPGEIKKPPNLPDIPMEEKTKVADKVWLLVASGKIREMPGGCSSIEECEAYCFVNPAQMRECLTFAEKHNLLSAEDLEEAKKIVLASLAKEKRGSFRPPNCPDPAKY